METKMNEESYRQLRRISNSDLSRFRDYLFGKKSYIPPRTATFGRALHATLLEPNVPQIEVHTADQERLALLEKNLRSHKAFNWYRQYSKKEHAQLFTDPATDLLCKARLDMVYQNRVVLDLKTTSAHSYQDFINQCHNLEYDRQAAFYLDSLGGTGKQFIFVGVQKKEPYDIFWFETTLEFLAEGRKKYQFLLETWKDVNFDFNQGEPWRLVA
ncbi:hypothetical protein C5O19_04545 [Siphonobacter curvatus]|uniref:Putative exodeoxyribonuclease 8 PDDEXK-like domain-containing protein n=2 Tax=Siphonobacter curvatus TaxID=2094562 RepID=A0A2S7IMG1_9BACT|nr:hypothetical protein C5O19_04545 [Siphonobacter curvatus]